MADKKELPELLIGEDSPASAKGSVWTEHSAPDGRKYYHNHETRESTWERWVTSG